VVAALALGACGTEAPTPSGERIISVAPNLTELLFAAGAAPQVVAVSEYSDYPEAAKSLPRIGDAFRLDYEAIVALSPTVAVIWDGGTPAGVSERLTELGIRVVGVPAYRLDDIATGLVELGALAGTEATAAAAAAEFRGRIEALRRTYRDRERLRVFVAIDDAPLFTVGQDRAPGQGRRQVQLPACAATGPRQIDGRAQEVPAGSLSAGHSAGTCGHARHAGGGCSAGQPLYFSGSKSN
jgi:ABC-type hemin transport system substrate-binding protein